MSRTTNLSLKANHDFENSAVLNHSVSQLAKTCCPTLKLSTDAGLGAGRQKKANPCTHTHAHTYTRQRPQPAKKQRHKLYKKAENDFLRAVPKIFEQVETEKVIFHNNDFVDCIYNDYSLPNANKFLAWVKTFAIMRNPYRENPVQGVIFSDDNDFLTALRLMKSQRIRPLSKQNNYEKRVWDMIERHFPKEEFQTKKLTNIMVVEGSTVRKVLNNFADKGKLTKKKKRGFSSHFYQVVTH